MNWLIHLILLGSVFIQVTRAQFNPALSMSEIENKINYPIPPSNSLEKAPGPEFRLPTSLIPRKYFIQIRPVIDKDHDGIGKQGEAPGTSKLTVTCITPTRRVVMHSENLKINEPSIEVRRMANDVLVDITSVEYDDEKNFLILNLSSDLLINEDYSVSIDFVANVLPGGGSGGLYTETYQDPVTKETRILAVTQLEPVRARQVFPCMDEPTYKTPFDVIIGRTRAYSSLGNAPLGTTVPDPENGEWVWDHFNTTVPMPTYLFAIAVSEYSFVEADGTLYRLPIRVYAPKHLVDAGKTDLAANASAMVMKYFEERYQVPHNNPKVDSITVPNKGGAMENYGLVTYGEPYLLYQEGVSSSSDVSSLYTIIGHELGHQWFGNLVTCKWWSDIWLNEGFASYVANDAVSAIWPEFKMNQVLGSVNSAMNTDAGPRSRPLHNEVYGPSEISGNMGTIAYDKGASVIRMLVSFMGEPTFYKGITQYLTKMYDSVAEQNDLFEALDGAANEAGLVFPKSILEIMQPWSLQKGFPLIRVSLLEEENSVTFSQELWQNFDIRNDSLSATWDVLIKYMVQPDGSSGQAGSIWMLADEQEKNLTIQDSNNLWVIINQDAGGYFRTIYDEELSARLKRQLETDHTALPEVARVRLLDDQLTAGFERYMTIQEALDFTKYLGSEEDPMVWSIVIRILNKVKNLYNFFILPDDNAALRDYITPKLGSVLSKITGNLKNPTASEYSSKTILASQLADWDCALGGKWCMEMTSKLFIEWQSGSPDFKDPVPVDFQSSVYCQMVKMFENSAFDLIYEEYRKATSSQRRARLSSSFGCLQSSDGYSELMKMMMNENNPRRIDKADSEAIFKNILVHTEWSALFLLQDMVANPNLLPDYYDHQLNPILRIINALSYSSNELSHDYLIREIMAANPEFYNDSLNPVLDSIQDNRRWLGIFRQNITWWFQDNASK